MMNKNHNPKRKRGAQPRMQDPLAYFLTWPTYGTWLPGTENGWVDFKDGWQLPDMKRLRESKAKMKESVCLLGANEQEIVERQIVETCKFRQWSLFAVECRSNHLHTVVGAKETDPMKIRKDIKAWCSRRLNEESQQQRVNWWAERGSVRWIFDEYGLDNVARYVNESQDLKFKES
jgi:REP element-mobilizing transposase RayT